MKYAGLELFFVVERLTLFLVSVKTGSNMASKMAESRSSSNLFLGTPVGAPKNLKLRNVSSTNQRLAKMAAHMLVMIHTYLNLLINKMNTQL